MKKMFALTSTGFQDGLIHGRYGQNSEHVSRGVPQLSFPLSWQNPPAGTKSYALVFQDFDNIPDEGFAWLHWLVCDIPAEATSLAENASRLNRDLIQGRNSWICPYGNYGLDESLTDYYGGPAPERDHEYEVSLYALDTLLGLSKGFYYNDLRRAMAGHILAEAVLKGVYKARA